MIKRIFLATIGAACLSASPVRAEELLLGQYDQMKGSAEFQFYIVGVANGFEWANVEYIRTNREPLFCLPMKHKLRKEEIWSLLDNQITILRTDKSFTERDAAFQARYSTSLVLLRALQLKYPCAASKP